MDSSAWYSPAKSEFAIVSASGSRRYIIHIAQQLAWISAVFRVPRDGELSYSDVVFEKRGPLEFQLMLMDLQTVKNPRKFCWHSLFVNSVMARGFATPDREKEVGIELPFDVMTSLACILYPMEYHEGVILRGISLTLVPTAYHSGSVQWHCVSSEQKSRLPRADEVMKQIAEWFETSDLGLLSTARTFLGYCSKAEIHLGTKDIDYKSIQSSGATSERTGVGLSGELPTSLGFSFKGFVTATLSPKFVLTRGLRTTITTAETIIEDRLLDAVDQPLLLYNVDKKQGWLVPELSVILHMAHAWASRQPDIPAEILAQVPHAEVSVDGGKAAWNAFLKGKGSEVRKVSLDGKPQLFAEVIKKIFSALEKRKDLAMVRDDISRMKSSKLCGWEFEDMVNGKYSPKRKEVDIDRKTAGEWNLIAAENPDLVVLFCNGLTQPIRPARHERTCSLLTPIPEGHCYLIASVPCLRRLSKDCGGTESSPKLTSKLHWHRPQGASLFEGCEYGVENGCNPLQEVASEKKAIAPGRLEPHGAVIFGKAKQKMRVWCEPIEAHGEDRSDESTMISMASRQTEESPSAAPPPALRPLPSTYIRQDRERGVAVAPYQISTNGSAQNSDPGIVSSLVSIEVHQKLTGGNLGVCPGNDGPRRARLSSSPDSRRKHPAQ